MQAIKFYERAIGQLIKNPQNAVHFDLLGRGEFSQRAITSQQTPAARFGDGKCKSVRCGKLDMLTVYYGCSLHFARCKFFDPKSKTYQSVT